MNNSEKLVWLEKQLKHMLKIEMSRFLKGEVILYSSEVALISEKISKIQLRKMLYFAGLPIGKLNKKFKIMPPLLWIIKDYAKNKVWVNEKAEQLFLYGRDIFASSIMKIEQGLRRRDLVIVLSKLNEPLGLGKMLVDAKYISLRDTDDDFVAVKNLMDMGWYIRKEKEI